MNFEEKSYSIQKNYFENILKDKNLIKKDFESVFKKDTVYRWKYERIMNNIEILFKLFPCAKWLTIGDGRFGSDAEYILNKTDYKTSVIASDISDYLLKYSKERGEINKIMKINAEQILLKDNSIDFTLCKESYHHFPRPNIALYEMIRVSRIGVILIEPTDYSTGQSIFKQLILKVAKSFFKRKGIKILEDSYENVGNFIYRLSRNEFKKMATGLNLSYIAFKGINDYNKNNPKQMIKFLDKLSKWGIISENLTISIIFKNELAKSDINVLTSQGFDVIKLSKNPYL